MMLLLLETVNPAIRGFEMFSTETLWQYVELFLSAVSH
jgi:hypothetical protein